MSNSKSDEFKLSSDRQNSLVKMIKESKPLSAPKTNFPKLESFRDVLSNSSALDNISRDEDIVYFFPANTCDHNESRDKWPSNFLESSQKVVIAGSAALVVIRDRLITTLNSMISTATYDSIKDNNLKNFYDLARKFTTVPQMTKAIELIRMFDVSDKDKDTAIAKLLEAAGELPGDIEGGNDFTPNDTDIFVIDSGLNNRLITPTVDIVYTVAKSVDELLLNFDLPCCRAAYSAGGYWVSAQCLKSLLYGYYHLPMYTKDTESMKKLFQIHRNGDPMKVSEEALHKKLFDRIKKYEDRGFEVIFYETDYLLPWIPNRFHYGEWDISNKVSPEVCYSILTTK